MMVSTVLFVTTLPMYLFDGSAVTNLSRPKGILVFDNRDAVRKGITNQNPNEIKVEKISIEVRSICYRLCC